MVNRAGELVGVIFDGNLPSLVWDFVYDDKEGRAIAVDGRAIQEALRRVYGAAALADELGEIRRRAESEPRAFISAVSLMPPRNKRPPSRRDKPGGSLPSVRDCRRCAVPRYNHGLYAPFRADGTGSPR